MTPSRWLLALTLALWSAPGNAELPPQQAIAGASITGMVRDADNQRVPGALVTLTGPDAGQHVRITDAEGFFAFTKLAAGTYRLVGRLAGFQDVHLEMRMVGSGTVDASFTLRIANQRIPDQPVEYFVEMLTGPKPENCGRLTIPHGRDPVAMEPLLKCALNASAGKRPFVAIKQLQGVDSTIFNGLLGRADGTILQFDYDSGCCGGLPRFTIHQCPVPFIVNEKYRLEFACRMER